MTITDIPPASPGGRTPSRGAQIRDIIAVYWIAYFTPGLPVPYGAPARVSFHFEGLPPDVQRESVTRARCLLSAVLDVTFKPRTVLAGDDTARCLLEARLPSGVTVVLMSKVSAEPDQDGSEDTAGELVAA